MPAVVDVDVPAGASALRVRLEVSERIDAKGDVVTPLAESDLDAIVEKYGKTHVIGGNADTRILLTGTKGKIRAEVERCMARGRNCPGYFMAVGNHIPANTPVENALYYNQVYEELSRR